MSFGRQSAPFRAAVFYSTLRNWGWGAPDYVWPIAAERLLRAKIAVTIVTQKGLLACNEITRLRSLGARCIAQPPVFFQQGRLGRSRAWLGLCHPGSLRVHRALKNAPVPYVFVNQAGSYDALSEPVLTHWLQKSSPAYDLFFRSNRYDSPLDANTATAAIELFRKANRCLFNSRWTREVTEKQLLQRWGNTSVFPHVVSFDYEMPIPWPESPELRFASVSRYDTHHKGLDVLLEALASLDPTLPPWTFDFYGRGAEREHLQNLACWLGLQERVHFHPYVADVRAIWKRCHVLVLPSRYEGLGVSMLEAMACGRPVVRTPYGGSAEWVIPGKTGLICVAPEPEIIAKTLSEALQQRGILKQMGISAHQHLRAHLPRDPESVYLSPFGLAEYHPVTI